MRADPASERPSPLAVTPEQAAEMLSLHRSMIYKLMASGELPSLKVGRARRIRLSDIEDWLEAAVSAPTDLSPTLVRHWSA